MEALLRQSLLLVLLAKCSALKHCENAGGDSDCGKEVVHAMVDGFAMHPEKFIGLTVHSSYSDFQAYFHNTGMHGCPRPCLPQEEKCVKFGPNYPGMTAILWVRNDGMRNHPQWFPELSSESSDVQIAKVLYQHGNKECPRVCLDDEKEGHFMSEEEWDQATKDSQKKKETEKKTTARSEPGVSTPFEDCGSPGISFSVLDPVGHLPAAKQSSQACQTHCAEKEAIYFNFNAPTQTCHCPPRSAKMVKSPMVTDIGGKVHCASIEYIKKLEDVPETGPAEGVNSNSGPSLLLLAMGGLAAVSAVVAFLRKSDLKEVDPSPCIGEADVASHDERVLILADSQSPGP